MWPIFGFAGGLIRISDTDVKGIWRTASRAILGWTPNDVSNVMLFTVALEPEDDYEWQLMRGGIRCLEWVTRKGTATRRWDADIMEGVARADIKEWAPGVWEIAEKHRWEIDIKTGTITKTSEEGDNREQINLLEAGKKEVAKWVTEVWEE